MRKRYLSMLLGVVFLVSAANPVYGGVVKRNTTTTTEIQEAPATNEDQSQESKNQETQATTDQSNQTDHSPLVKQQDMQDGASKYAICTYQGRTYPSNFHLDSNGNLVGENIKEELVNLDGSPRKIKPPVIYPVEVYKSSDWLFPNGVAKTPGYLGAELKFESADFDGRTK